MIKVNRQQAYLNIPSVKLSSLPGGIKDLQHRSMGTCSILSALCCYYKPETTMYTMSKFEYRPVVDYLTSNAQSCAVKHSFERVIWKSDQLSAPFRCSVTVSPSAL